MPVYDKKRIKSAFDKYLLTEDPNDFGNLLHELKPMIKNIVQKCYWLDRFHEDMTSDVMLILWKEHSSVNRLKLLRIQLYNSGEEYDVANTFYFMIRGFMSSIIARFNHIYFNDSRFGAWNFPAEDWVYKFEDVEGYGKNDEGKEYMTKLVESE